MERSLLQPTSAKWLRQLINNGFYVLKYRFSFILLISLLSLGNFSHAQADVILITSPDFSVNSIPLHKLKKLWLGTVKKIPGVGRTYIVDRNLSSAVAATFYLAVTHKTPDQVNAYWAKLQFIGKSYPPKRLSTDIAVMKWVKEAANRIGYIDETSLTPDFKVIKIIKGGGGDVRN